MIKQPESNAKEYLESSERFISYNGTVVFQLPFIRHERHHAQLKNQDLQHRPATIKEARVSARK